MDNNGQLLTEKIADALWQIWRCWRLTSHPVKQGKITPEQYWVLHILHRFGPQRIKDIAVRIGTGSSSVTAIIDFSTLRALIISAAVPPYPSNTTLSGNLLLKAQDKPICL